VIPAIAARQGGPAYAVVNLSAALQASGCESTIFATDLLRPAAARSQSRARADDLPELAAVTDVHLFRAEFPRRFAYSGQLARALYDKLGTYDVLHIHSLYLFPQLAAFLAAQRRGVPYVVSPHGVLNEVIRRQRRRLKLINDFLWLRRMLDRAGGLHYTCEAEARNAIDLRLRAPSFIVPNGIAFDELNGPSQPERFRQRFFPGFSGDIVLSLGRIARVKGLDVLVRAFAQLEASSSRLAIVGPDDEEFIPVLIDLARRLRIHDRVVFTGELRGSDRLDALAAASVCALPSKTENFGHAIVEAMAAGLPVVLSGDVALADEIKGRNAGLVVSRAPNSFASAVNHLLSDSGARVVIAERARNFAKRFDWSEVTPKLLTMYETVRTRHAQFFGPRGWAA
jgi:glycosyltransferase involved in cell wall biosynthesis